MSADQDGSAESNARDETSRAGARSRHPAAPHLNWFGRIVIWRGVRWFVWVFFRVLYGLKPTGDVKLPPSGPVLFVCNHQSHYDPPAIGSLVYRRPCGYVARASLFKHAAFAWLIRSLGAVPMDPAGRSRSALRAAEGVLGQGGSMLMFPEGTRTPDGTIKPFKPGFLLLLRRTKPIVVPVAIEGMFDVWPRSRSKPRWRAKATAVNVGEAVPSEELLAMGEKELLDWLRTRIEELRLEAREHLRKRTNGRVPAAGAADQPYWEQDESPAGSAA